MNFSTQDSSYYKIYFVLQKYRRWLVLEINELDEKHERGETETETEYSSGI